MEKFKYIFSSLIFNIAETILIFLDRQTIMFAYQLYYNNYVMFYDK